MMNINELEMSSIVVEDVDPTDRPDFSDAFIASANWESGTELNDEELEALNNENPDLVNEKAHDSLI